MRAQITPTAVSIWASARDTYDWSHRPGKRWPCSELSGRRFFASFDRRGLVDLSVDGGRGEQDIDGHELTACCSDLLAGKIPADHPAACYFDNGEA